MILTAKVIALSEPLTEGGAPRATLTVKEAFDFFCTLQVANVDDMKLGDKFTLTLERLPEPQNAN